MNTASNTPGPTPLRCVRGVIAPLYTPFRADRTIDYGAVQGLIDYLAATKAVSSVFARSGVGQIFTFTVDETKQFGQRVRDAVSGGMGMLLGCPGEWLNRNAGERPDPERYVAQGVELTQHAEKIGVDAAVHPLPVALEPRDGEPAAELVFRYYQTVHDASNIPVVIYQQPGTAREYCLSPDLIRRLLALPRIAGAKISSKEDEVMVPLLDAADCRAFGVVCGHECYYLRGLQRGATGVLGQGSMIVPEIQYAVQHRFRAGDMAGAQEAQDDVAKAMLVTDGLSRSVACKQYVRRKGAALEAYERGACEPYDQGTSEPYPDDVIDRIERGLDAFKAKYRVA